MAFDKKTDLSRPELVKSEHCAGKVCTDCSDRKQCWRGSSGDELALDVQAGSTFTEFAAEIWARCVKGGSWQVQVEKSENGRISIYVDGILFKEVDQEIDCVKKGRCIDGADGEEKPCCWIASERIDIESKMTADSHHLKIVFRPTIQSEASSAQIEAKVKNVDKYTDECMGTKHCLTKVFGDENDDAGFKLRNSNEMQLCCLEEKGLPAELQAKCNEWTDCLPDAEELKLKIFLRAALLNKAAAVSVNTVCPGKSYFWRFPQEAKHQSDACTVEGGDEAWHTPGECWDDKTHKCIPAIRGAGLLAQGHRGGRLDNGEDEQEDDCLDPATVDPEALDCECLEEMIETCGDDDEQCLKELMCKNPKVCDRWKQQQQQCSSSLITALERMKEYNETRGGGSSIAMAQKRLKRIGNDVTTRGGVVSRSEGGLDSTMQGKCTSETQ